MKKNMNKLSKTILIGLAATLLFLPSLAAANGLLNIDFEQEPLFQETNFLPGQSVERWIEVENKSSETQAIAIEVINYSSCTSNCFSEQLELTIKRNSTELYKESLDDFFKAGEIKLSDLAAGVKTKYFFSVTFLPESDNQYQEKTLNFDFKIGSLTKKSDEEKTTPENGEGISTTGGGGGFFITGLEIFNETIASVEATQATITWETNKPATSRVIYSSENQPHILLLDSPPNYGYADSTSENSSLKVLHSMVVSGLEPATTYYFRCISRGSLAVSTELKFTTASVKGEEIVLQPPATPPQPAPDILGEDIEIIETETTEEDEQEEEDISEQEETPLLQEEAEDEEKTSFCWLLLIIFIILLILSVVYGIKRQRKGKWVLPLLTLILAILYYLLCCPTCWILILIAFILLALSLMFGRKKKETV